MNANKVIEVVMERGNYNTTSLRTALGWEPKKSNVLISRLHQANMSIAVLDELLSKMGYMLVAMPNNGEMPKNGIRVDYTETDEHAERKQRMREAQKSQNTKKEET